MSLTTNTLFSYFDKYNLYVKANGDFIGKLMIHMPGQDDDYCKL